MSVIDQDQLLATLFHDVYKEFSHDIFEQEEYFLSFALQVIFNEVLLLTLTILLLRSKSRHFLLKNWKLLY